MARGAGRPLKYLTWTLPPEAGDSGVFAIECTVTGKVYVGASKNIKNALTQHRLKLRNGIHVCQDMQIDYLVLGAGAFQVKLLEPWKEWDKENDAGVSGYNQESLAKCRRKWLKIYLYAERGTSSELYNKPHHKTLSLDDEDEP